MYSAGKASYNCTDGWLFFHALHYFQIPWGFLEFYVSLVWSLSISQKLLQIFLLHTSYFIKKIKAIQNNLLLLLATKFANTCIKYSPVHPFLLIQWKSYALCGILILPFLLWRQSFLSHFSGFCPIHTSFLFYYIIYIIYLFLSLIRNVLKSLHLTLTSIPLAFCLCPQLLTFKSLCSHPCLSSGLNVIFSFPNTFSSWLLW